MDTTTQRQKLWHMAFSRKLAEVTGYLESSLYWKHAADTIRKRKGETEETVGTRRAGARTQAANLRVHSRIAENALCEWVTSHPYPSDES